MSAPRCVGFEEHHYTAVRPGRAAAMHCSHPCERGACPAGFRCFREVTAVGLGPGQITSSDWCGRPTSVEPTPLSQIPRQQVARVLEEEGLAEVPLVVLYWEGAELVVVGPGVMRRAGDETAARLAFAEQAEEVRRWADSSFHSSSDPRDAMPQWSDQPAEIPRGPHAAGAIPPSARKTMASTRDTDLLASISTRESLARDGAVLTWSFRGSRRLHLYAETSVLHFDVARALDEFFALPAPSR